MGNLFRPPNTLGGGNIYLFFSFFCKPDLWRDLDGGTPGPAAQVPNPQPRRLRPAHKASPPAARNAEASREASRCDAHRVLRPAPRQGHHGGVCRHHADRGLTLTTRQTREVVSADPLPRWPQPVARLWTLVPAPPAVEQGPPLAHPPWMALQVPSCEGLVRGCTAGRHNTVHKSCRPGASL